MASIFDRLRKNFSGDYTRAAPIAPVLQGQAVNEALGDPRLTQLYFGTSDSPGFLQQLRDAAGNLISQDVPLQETAQISDLEQAAIDRARAGIGSFTPFLSQNQALINQAIAQSRRAEQLQEPYFGRAEEILGTGLTGLQGALGESRDILRNISGLSFDPRFTQQFMNPFQQQVIDQTVGDVLRTSAQQDIRERAADIARGGESAFGSRARLGAAERQRALGRGLGEALSGIRSRGFERAQQLGLAEFSRQLDAQRQLASSIAGLGGTEAAAQRGFAGDLLGLGAQRGSTAAGLGTQLAGYGGQLGQLGGYQQQLSQNEQNQLRSLGQIPRGIQETQFQRQFAQQMGQQQRPLQTLSGIAGLLPQYRSTSTTIAGQYGIPRDPLTAGLQGAAGLYGGLYSTLNPSYG
jgi:hypothetical protein